MKNTVTKYLLIFLALAFILIITISYLLYLKKSAPQTNPASTAEPSQEETAFPPPAAGPIEGNIGTVVDLVVQPDGKVTLTIDSQPAGQKTYQLPSDQQVKLYTSDTETTSVPIGQIQKGTTVNVMKFTKPERYEIIGVTDKDLSGKLI